MKTLKEQILEILNKYKNIEYWYFFGKESEHEALINLASPENIADEIMALPIDVPTEDEIGIAADEAYYDEVFDDKLIAFIDGAKWAIAEIIKRNQWKRQE